MVSLSESTQQTGAGLHPEEGNTRMKDGGSGKVYLKRPGLVFPVGGGAISLI